MNKVDIRADITEARAAFRELGPAVDKAAARALNKTAVAVRKKVIPEIRKERMVKAAFIREQIKILRANFHSLVVTLAASGKSIPMRHFSASQTKKGVTVRIKQGTKRRLLTKHGNKSFINASSKLGPNIFVRVGKSRLPIERWSPVPGIPRVFAKRIIMQHMTGVARDVWPRRFREEVNFEVKKAIARARRS